MFKYMYMHIDINTHICQKEIIMQLWIMRKLGDENGTVLSLKSHPLVYTRALQRLQKIVESPSNRYHTVHTI